MTPFSAVLFDMDGVLVDSEMYWDINAKDFFAFRGLTITPELKRRLSGGAVPANVAWLKDTYSWPEPLEELLGQYNGFSERIYDEQAMPLAGVHSFLPLVKQKGYKTAIGSGSSLSRIQKIVDRFSWHNHFDTLVSSDHVRGVGKPAPDIFIHAASTLGVAPNACVVIEDSENGVKAAKAAGMTCVAIPDVRWSHGDFSQADIVCESMEDKKLHHYILGR